MPKTLVAYSPSQPRGGDGKWVPKSGGTVGTTHKRDTSEPWESHRTSVNGFAPERSFEHMTTRDQIAVSEYCSPQGFREVSDSFLPGASDVGLTHPEDMSVDDEWQLGTETINITETMRRLWTTHEIDDDTTLYRAMELSGSQLADLQNAGTTLFHYGPVSTSYKQGAERAWGAKLSGKIGLQERANTILSIQVPAGTRAIPGWEGGEVILHPDVKMTSLGVGDIDMEMIMDMDESIEIPMQLEDTRMETR